MAHDDIGAAGQAPECQTCPICAGRPPHPHATPAAVDHLYTPGAELLRASWPLLDMTAAPARGPASRRRRGHPAGNGDGALAHDGLQRIDIG